jgi:hypothetical protein
LVEGVDPESDSSYLNRLVSELQMIAPRPITPNDFAQLSQNTSGVTRSLAIDGYSPFSNILSANDADLTQAVTNNYVAVGDGTVVPTLAFGSPQSTTGLSLTMAAISAKSTLANSSAAGATSLISSSATPVSSTVSLANPTFVAIVDSSTNDEIVEVISASGSTVTLAHPTKFAHASTASFVPLQGVAIPLVSNLAPNTSWLQACALIENGTDTNGVVTPYIFAIAEDAFGNFFTYSSILFSGDGGFDYTGLVKTVVANIYSNSNVSVAPSALSLYNSINAEIVSVQAYVLFANATSAKTHNLLYAGFFQSEYDFSSGAPEDPKSAASDYNLVPDAFLTYAQSNPLSSWNLASGLVALPNFGVRFVGTGSALTSNLVARSQVINLSMASGGAFTAVASIDTTYASYTYEDVSLRVVNADTGAILSSAPCTFSGVNNLVANLTITQSTDVYLEVVFGSGLNVSSSASVIARQFGLFNGAYTNAQFTSLEIEPGFSWSPGGLFGYDSFSATREITLCPVDSNGISVSDAVADNLQDYLSSRRELNFIVNTIKPNYVQINVNWSAVALPGYDSASVQTAGNLAISNYLNPANWAGGFNTPPNWDSTKNAVRILDIAGVLSAVTGIGTVTSVTISNSTLVAPSANDIILPGAAPMPIANVISGSVISNPINATIGGI